MSECSELLCGGCSETFEDREERRGHRIAEHPEECARIPYMYCAFCGKAQESQLDAYDHLVEKHPSQWTKMVARMLKVSRLKEHQFHERWALADSACLDTKRLGTLKSVLQRIDAFWTNPEKENEVPPSTSSAQVSTSTCDVALEQSVSQPKEIRVSSGFDPESSLAEALFAEDNDEAEESNQTLQTHFATISQMISPVGSDDTSRDNTDTTDSSLTQPGTDQAAAAGPVKVIPQGEPERATVITQQKQVSPARKRVRCGEQSADGVPRAVLKRPRIVHAPPPPTGPPPSTMPEIPVDVVCVSADQSIAYINLPATYYGGRVLEAPMRVGRLQGQMSHGLGPSNQLQQVQQQLLRQQQSCSNATPSAAVSASRPVLQVDQATLSRMYATDPAFKALYDAAMAGVDPAQPCSSSSIQWGFKPTAAFPTTTATTSFATRPSTSSSSIDAAIDATVAQGLASCGRTPHVGSHEVGDPDTDYWNHRGDYRMPTSCPRCSFVHFANGPSRRQHYIRQHYNIYYAKAQKTCVSDAELLKCMALGEALGTPRACLFCEADPTNFRSRESLLAHHMKYHPIQFASFSHELNRLQMKL